MSNDNFSSVDFIEKLKLRDKIALSALVEAYTSHLFKAGLGMGLNEEQAHDTAHATWTTFLEIIPRFEGRSHIRTFVFGIFYNKVSEIRRANLKFAKTDPIEDIMESKFLSDGHWKEGVMDPSHFAESAQTMSIIEKCLEALPFIQRAVFTMKIVEEDESENICNVLDISSTNLRQLLYRGKNRLRECIEKKSKTGEA
jgi:RNA polymerase sigma-70 factor (ECF subfamily)